MKLNPPASSSDLEAAREIALRLHHHRRRGDVSDHAAAPPPAGGAVSPARRAVVPPPPPPAPPPPLEPALGSWPAAESWPPPSDLDIELPSVSAEELIDTEEGPGPSPFDEAEGGRTGAEPPVLEIEEDEHAIAPEALMGPSVLEGELPEAPEAPPADLFTTPPPPSWDDVIETCFDLSMSTGAMLIDPAGQVFAARGDWPDPGAEAIAAKLVAMLDRTLRDAPTRSVSAPVAGRHLTAWRVPLAEGLVTVAFVGDAPLRAELRPVIDEQILRGAGA